MKFKLIYLWTFLSAGGYLAFRYTANFVYDTLEHTFENGIAFGTVVTFQWFMLLFFSICLVNIVMDYFDYRKKSGICENQEANKNEQGDGKWKFG